MYLYTLDYLKGRIAVALAGALAEEKVLGNRSTGAASDFAYAADLAKQIVFGGMSPLGIVSKEDLPKELLHSTLSVIMKEAEACVQNVLGQHEVALRETVQALQTKESLTGEELRAVLSAGAKKSA